MNSGLSSNASSPPILSASAFPSLENISSTSASTSGYKRAEPHWFYHKKFTPNPITDLTCSNGTNINVKDSDIQSLNIWEPFSLSDSIRIENKYKYCSSNNNNNTQENQFDRDVSSIGSKSLPPPHNPNFTVIHTDGGRYDVDLATMERKPVYWTGNPDEVYEVRRCTWFYINPTDAHYIPYEQKIATLLENEYRKGVISDLWNRRFEDPDTKDLFIMYDDKHFVQIKASNGRRDEWATIFDGRVCTLIVKRGVVEYDRIQDGEMSRIDHVIFVIHGIGEYCDFKFRTINQCVDGMREMSASLLKTHFKKYAEKGMIGRVEFIPCNWHKMLHSDTLGVDKRLRSITLSSIKKLRDYTNDTIVDVLFYTSPIYCQTIMDTVGNELNKLFELFLERNPGFDGTVSIIGHSLGSLIAFDLLSHQTMEEALQKDLENSIKGILTSGAASGKDEDSSSYHAFSAGSKFTVGEPDFIEPFRTSLDDDPHNTTLLQGGEDNLKDWEERLRKSYNVEDEWVDLLVKEGLDKETLLCCNGLDFKELGIPLGPRKKIISFITDCKRARLAKTVSHNNATLYHSAPGSSEELSYYQPPATSKIRKFSYPTIDADSLRNCSADDANLSESGGLVTLDSVIAANTKGGLPITATHTPSPVGGGSRNSTTTGIVPPVTIEATEVIPVGEGTGQPRITYTKLLFKPDCFFALGSPIGLFLTIRGIELIGSTYTLPTCPRFFNIFHPYDPVAYRIEPLVIPHPVFKPLLVPHHKGRKRMHLELKENINKMSYDLKHSLYQTFKNTMDSLHHISFMAGGTPPGTSSTAFQNTGKRRLESSRSAFQISSTSRAPVNQDLNVIDAVSRKILPDNNAMLTSSNQFFKLFTNVVNSSSNNNATIKSTTTQNSQSSTKPKSSSSANDQSSAIPTVIYSALSGGSIRVANIPDSITNDSSSPYPQKTSSPGLESLRRSSTTTNKRDEEETRIFLRHTDPAAENLVAKLPLIKRQRSNSASSHVTRNFITTQDDDLIDDSSSFLNDFDFASLLSLKPTGGKSQNAVLSKAEQKQKAPPNGQSMFNSAMESLSVSTEDLFGAGQIDPIKAIDTLEHKIKRDALQHEANERGCQTGPKDMQKNSLSTSGLPPKYMALRNSLTSNFTNPSPSVPNRNRTFSNSTDFEYFDSEHGGSSPQSDHCDFPMGQLNRGKRIDYTLQEKPIEMFNEYLFALHSHVCYWESEDTLLMILNELYSVRSGIHGSLHQTFFEEIKEAIIPSMFTKK